VGMVIATFMVFMTFTIPTRFMITVFHPVLALLHFMAFAYCAGPLDEFSSAWF
jgi:hypothetical protein